MADAPGEDPRQVADGSDRGPMDPGAHDERHELAVASLVDRDLDESNRWAAEALVASCPACARLRIDLAAIAAATRSTLVPARPRDFRLTTADAARLAPARAATEEPRGDASRLTGEMQLPSNAHHAHDRLLIAGLVDRSPDDDVRRSAETLIAVCVDCAALHRDLVALRDATQALPTPPRTRDYSIESEMARRLRHAGWRRWIAVFGSTRDAFSRPLAIGLTTIGLAGLLVTSVPSVLLSGSATSGSAVSGQAEGGAGSAADAPALEGAKLAPEPSAAPSAAAAAAPAAAAAAPSATPLIERAAGPSAGPAQPAEPAPTGETFDTFAGGPAASPGAGVAVPGPTDSGVGTNAGGDLTTSLAAHESVADRLPVALLAGLLLGAGLGLFALRWAGRRI